MYEKIIIPGDVPRGARGAFHNNYHAITQHNGRLLLFAADHKIEHLNADFYGEGIAPEALNPHHLFEIAGKAQVGAFATQLGLITRYGYLYPQVNYIAKLNAKTDLIKTEQHDPISEQLWTVDDVMAVQKNTGLNIRGVGCTLYLGSVYEEAMLAQAAEIIFDAHQRGLIATLWIYLRGKAIADDQAPELIAGAAGIANALGADFVKVKPPMQQGENSAQLLSIAAQAAGNTKLICSGGKRVEVKHLLQEVYNQIHTGSAAGCATGRNIFQRPLPEAVALCKALAALIYENKEVNSAFEVYAGYLKK